MQEIADWLEKLGLSEYAQPFIDHKIDISVLGYLTDQDLKDIGIPLGHRRKILAAIGELTGAAATTTKPPARQEPDTQDTAERRQITVQTDASDGSEHNRIVNGHTDIDRRHHGVVP
jgi:SAM domain (Sterile alpha motif)